ncbi:MAG: V-type ATP synthase subunit I [Chlamydiales bacterium]|nr:V-type ATP synthase subunit I [Chlamydiales bacterium]
MDLDLFFQKAQKLGLIEFIPAQHQRHQAPSYIDKMMQAIQILKKQPLLTDHYPEDLNAADVVDGILNCKTEIDHLFEDKRIVLTEIEKLLPFGDFSLDEIKEIEDSSDLHMYFYAAKHGKEGNKDISPDLIHVNTDHDLDYYISLTKQPIQHHGLYIIQITQNLSTLREELEIIQRKTKLKRHELKEFAKYLPLLKTRLIEDLNHMNLVNAKLDVDLKLEESIFIAEAWVPHKYIHKIKQIIKPLHVVCEEIAIEKHDRVPTYMENQGIGAIGEDLVHIYDVPSTNDRDPSIWVFFSFALFFSMIVGDAGYGFIYLLVALFLKWKYRKAKGLLNRFIKLTKMLSITCIVWGFLITSFFGLELSPSNPLTKFSLTGFLAQKKATYHIQQKDGVYQLLLEEYPALKGITDPKQFLLLGTVVENGEIVYQVSKDFTDNIMMEISLIVGMVHVSLSLLRNIKRSYSHIGWTLFIFGGYFYFPKILDASSLINVLGVMSAETSCEVGLQLLGTGVFLAILLSMIQNSIFKALYELFKIIEIFADVLSYLRLYALGLASMILANTFNGIGKDAGLFFGCLIILVGHVTNIVLGIMSGVIHGLRLNFLEWYHHSFEGGGKKFNPLKLLSIRSE